MGSHRWYGLHSTVTKRSSSYYSQKMGSTRRQKIALVKRPYLGLQQMNTRLLLDIDSVDTNCKVSHSEYGQTPLAWAARKGHEAVVRLLLAEDIVGWNVVDEHGRTPLSLAAEEGHEAGIKLLRHRGTSNT
ncbi:hypothetical protein BS50DRAFT_591161 [Corynespora cassiicola Philippines]|uniref:Uncharacterized protein n=1 Tax=Corynespora cassiicola Philippines TaxID=1448308 RepID=A0A2T2NCF8_CORCC|nr:hypothetical protein BS50DRAFT_591161 [Corynespora cassiicola Philippines]